MKIILLILTLILSSTSLAKTNNNPGAWIGLFTKKDLGNNFSMWGDYQLRYSMAQGEMQQTLFRFGPIWKFSERQEIGLLYGFVESTVKEYRTTFHHQIYVNPKLILRSRLEYRNLEDNDDDSLRFRHLIRYIHPLKNSLSLLFWEEPFLNLTSDSWTERRFFDRNRIFLGFRFPALNMQMEAGYMNQFVPRSKTNTVEHLALLAIFY